MQRRAGTLLPGIRWPWKYAELLSTHHLVDGIVEDLALRGRPVHSDTLSSWALWAVLDQLLDSSQLSHQLLLCGHEGALV